MPPILNTALERLGLGDKERLILLALLQSGPMLVANVARVAKLNRTTTYGVLKELAEKGLASSAKHGQVLRYQSIAPELLPSYIERHSKELEESKKEVERVIPQIKLLRLKGKILPKIQFFEGEEGVMAVYDDHLEQESYEMLGFADPEKIIRFLPAQYYEQYRKIKEKRGVTTRGILADSPSAKNFEVAYKNISKEIAPGFRILPREQFPFPGEITIYGKDKVSIINLQQENPSALIIEDASYHQMMRIIFELVWKGLPPISFR